MKAYNYFLFRIFKLYKEKMKESDSLAIFSTLALSTSIVSVNLITIYLVGNFFGLIPIVTNKLYIIFFMFFVGFINYWFFIRGRSFLNHSFQKEKIGGVLIIGYVVFTFLVFFFVAQNNRAKIFKEKQSEISKEPKRESLEGKIRKWFD